jgi:hypothetical protein
VGVSAEFHSLFREGMGCGTKYGSAITATIRTIPNKLLFTYLTGLMIIETEFHLSVEKWLTIV